jgi:hypothetical protein
VALGLGLKRLQVSGLWIPGLPLQLRLELLAQLRQIEQLSPPGRRHTRPAVTGVASEAAA